jgi:hypothetical protein
MKNLKCFHRMKGMKVDHQNDNEIETKERDRERPGNTGWASKG